MLAELEPCYRSWSHVAGAGRPYALLQGRGVGKPDGIDRAPELKRTTGLKILQLQINLGRAVIDVEAHQRRPNGNVRDSLGGGANIVYGNCGYGTHFVVSFAFG